jgi:hypothetical protein
VSRFGLSEAETEEAFFFGSYSDKVDAALESIRSNGEPGAVVIGQIKQGKGVEMQNLEQWSS